MGGILQFPKMYRIRQTFDPRKIDDIGIEVKAGMAAMRLESKITAGQTVAVACSSRGIANYSAIVKEVVSALRTMKLEPVHHSGDG